MTPEKRLEAFQKLVEQRPGEPFARYSLAMALRSLGRGQDAEREFEVLRERSPGYVPGYLMHGQVLESLGRLAEAVRAYEEGMARAEAAGDQHARGELQQALEVLRAQGI